MNVFVNTPDVERNVFIDPSPMSLSRMTEAQMENQHGGAIFVIVIVACGGRLGAATVITVGTAVVTVID